MPSTLAVSSGGLALSAMEVVLGAMPVFVALVAVTDALLTGMLGRADKDPLPTRLSEEKKERGKVSACLSCSSNDSAG